MILVRAHGHDHTSAHVADRFPCLIGRSIKCAIRIDDPSVSALHARIDVRGDGYVLQDLGSTNGIVHHGQRIAELPLTRDETVCFGDVQMQFIVDEALPKTRSSERVDALPETPFKRTAVLTLVTTVTGFIALCAPAAAKLYASFWPPERPQDIATTAFALWLGVMGLAFVVSLFCKLNSRRFHFFRIFSLMVATILAADLLANLMGTVVFNLHAVRYAFLLRHLGYALIAFGFIYKIQRYAFSRWSKKLRAAVATGFALVAAFAVEVTELSERGAGNRTDLTELGLPVVDPTGLDAKMQDLSSRMARSAAVAETERTRVLEKILRRAEEDAEDQPRRVGL